MIYDEYIINFSAERVFLLLILSVHFTAQSSILWLGLYSYFYLIN